jgi:pimeloyl-ACP methyl ester carboxylesterase
MSLPLPLPAGVYYREGFIIQPNAAPTLAYQLWSNQELITPEEQSSTAEDESSDEASQPSRMNLLLLHDQGDNAASFTRLAPALIQALSPKLLADPPANVCLLAVDLPGHGRSAWRPRDGNYSSIVHAVSDLSQMLANVLKWRECALIGHGGGALMAALLASSRIAATATSGYGAAEASQNAWMCLTGSLPLCELASRRCH